MFSAELRRRLSEISRGKSGVLRQVPEPRECADYLSNLEFNGTVQRNESGTYLVSEYSMTDLLNDASAIIERFSQVTKTAGYDPSKLLFLDLETCGLANVPLFLIGTMRFKKNDFEIRQLFARDYVEEKNVLWQVREDMNSIDCLVTFNGKAFDLPFINDRMIYHRLEFSPPRVHNDLIYGARRKWRRTLPNCRLQTLETHICRRTRLGDVPGSKIPLLTVFKHNVMDLMTMAELLPEVVK
jgi:uncharacterized protein YprB with RNaseH-like and TPR domain